MCSSDLLNDLPSLHFQVDEGASSFAKLYLRTDRPNSELIAALMERGVDAKQLTKSHGLYLQKRIDHTTFLWHESVNECANYLAIHDYVIELPLSSTMTKTELDAIVDATKHCLK